MGCRAGFCGLSLKALILEALILGFVSMAGHQVSAAEAEEGAGLKGFEPQSSPGVERCTPGEAPGAIFVCLSHLQGE